MACIPGTPCNPTPVDIVSPKKCNNGWFAGYPVNSSLICYNGSTLPNTGITAGDSLNVALDKIDDELSPTSLAQTIINILATNPNLASIFCGLVNNCIPTTSTTTTIII
jgi:hypothetical protein